MIDAKSAIFYVVLLIWNVILCIVELRDWVLNKTFFNHSNSLEKVYFAFAYCKLIISYSRASGVDPNDHLPEFYMALHYAQARQVIILL